MKRKIYLNDNDNNNNNKISLTHGNSMSADH